MKTGITPKTNAEITLENIKELLEISNLSEYEKREITAMVAVYGDHCVDKERKRQFRDRIGNLN